MTKHSGDPASGRPLKPSNDTSRIVTSLLFSSPSRNEAERASAKGGYALSAAVVESAIRERTLRLTFVPAELLTDAAWDILLELLHAELTQRRVTSSILCKAAGVQASSGRRWIDALVATGLCTRGAGGQNSDSVELSQHGSRAMRGYFAELARRNDQG